MWWDMKIVLVVMMICLVWGVPVGEKGVYDMYKNMDMVSNDMGCFKEEVSFCKNLCDESRECVGYNFIHPNGPWGGSTGCCYKHIKSMEENIVDVVLNRTIGIDFYVARGISFSLPSESVVELSFGVVYKKLLDIKNEINKLIRDFV